MTRTITVSQPTLISSALTLTEEGTPESTFAFIGLLKRTAELKQETQRLTFTTVGLLGRTVRAENASGDAVGEFRRTGILTKGDAQVNGRHYRLKVSGVLRRRFYWLDANGKESVCLELGGWLRTSGTIEITDSGAPDDAAVLIGLGLIARRALENDSGAAGAGVAG